MTASACAHAQQVGIVDAVDGIARILFIGLADPVRRRAQLGRIHLFDRLGKLRHRACRHPVLGRRRAAGKREDDQRSCCAAQDMVHGYGDARGRHVAFLIPKSAPDLEAEQGKV
jgi:hypothetical protein